LNVLHRKDQQFNKEGIKSRKS